MRKASSLRSTAALAALAVVPAGLIALAAPANATTTQTASLQHGVLTISGTAAGDLIGVVTLRPEVEVDFGLDGTVERRFLLSRVKSIKIRTAGGNDVVHLTGAGVVPLSLTTGPGFDFVNAHGLVGDDGANQAPTSIRTQSGKDTVLTTTAGPTTINTGGGPDSVQAGTAGVGSEDVTLGGGNDFFIGPMDTSLGARQVVVDSGRGQDIMEVDGTDAGNSLDLSAHDGHLLITHNQSATIDSSGLEQLVYASIGGQQPTGLGDTVTVGDLTGAGLVRFIPDFSSDVQQTDPNAHTDHLVVDGTDGVDNITVRGADRDISVEGLATQVTPIWLNTPDTLTIDTLGGDDHVDTSGLEDGLVRLRIR